MAEKSPHLVVYDYGPGGLWAVIMARSEEEIHETYPELSIVKKRPDWMEDAPLEQISDIESHDIDGAPWGILDVVLGDRREKQRNNLPGGDSLGL